MSSKELIMAELKDDILSLKLKPGMLISETALSERFQLSRTPIRDILKQLSNEDYIRIYPKKGNIVSYIDLESVEQIIYLRSTLEKEIMKELSRRPPLKGIQEIRGILEFQRRCIEQEEGFERFLELDDAFHQSLFELAGRGFLWKVIQQFNVHYVRYRKLHLHKREKLAELQEEHQLMLNRIMDGESERIDELVHNHLRADIHSSYFQEHFAEYIGK